MTALFVFALVAATAILDAFALFMLVFSVGWAGAEATLMPGFWALPIAAVAATVYSVIKVRAYFRGEEPRI